MLAVPRCLKNVANILSVGQMYATVQNGSKPIDQLFIAQVVNEINFMIG